MTKIWDLEKLSIVQKETIYKANLNKIKATLKLNKCIKLVKI